MSVSSIDALMQIATPARTSDAAPRASDREAFGPALEQACRADAPRQTAPRREDADEADADDKVEESGLGDDAPETAGHEGELSTEEAVAVDEAAAESTEAEESDSAEFSEEASGDAEQVATAVAVVAAVIHAEPAVPEMTAEEVLAAASEAGEPMAMPEGSPTQTPEADKSSAGESEIPSEGSKPTGETLVEALDAAVTGGGKDAASAKRGKSAPTEKEAEAKPAGEEAEEVPQVEEKAGEAPAPSETMRSEADGKATDGERDVRKGEAAEGVERLPLPAAEATAELTAAIDRQATTTPSSTENGETGARDATSKSADAAASGSAAPQGRALADRVSAAALRRSENANADHGPPIDRHRFVQRVEGAMKAAQQRDGRVQVRLAPPELGSLKIELAVQNGVMSAKLEAENSAARNALLDNLPALRERLAEQSIRIEKFDVDVRQESQGGNNNASYEQPGEQREPGAQEQRRRPEPTTAKRPGVNNLRTTAAAANSGLDVRV